MPRMNVLSPFEQEQFDTPPVFTSAQRKHFFAFPLGIRELAVDLGVCSIGTRKMARISSNIKETALQQTVSRYFSLENVQAANDSMVKFMDQMELPNLYRHTQVSLHTACDGQKSEVRQESLSASERENAYVVDGLMRNDVIKSAIHSTYSKHQTAASLYL